MEILGIYLEEQLLIKCCMIKALILLKVQNMLDIKIELLQWLRNFSTKKTLGCAVKSEIMPKKSTLIFYRQYLGC